jgi:hypothetical protein
MLDFNRVAKQIPLVSEHIAKANSSVDRRLQAAMNYWEVAVNRQQELREKQQNWQKYWIFNAGVPIEPIETIVTIAPSPRQYNAIATDGSQIAPSHHEIAYCYLINIGRIVFSYGQGRHPLLNSIPEVFYRDEDLYEFRQWGIGIEEWLSYRRTMAEAANLAELAVDLVAPPFSFDDTPASPTVPAVPTIAMADGSLVYWFLEQLPPEPREFILTPTIEAWERLQGVGVPSIGYLSASRSTETVNWLRTAACPYPHPHCQDLCSDVKKPPCQLFDGVRDATFWNRRLLPGQRSGIWASNSRICDLYPDDLRVQFCYLNVGTEVARIEFPAWVGNDRALLDLALSQVVSQVRKGFGYPVCLSEAHNYAVIRSADRASFFALLERQLVATGVRDIGTSYKEARKRSSIA